MIGEPIYAPIKSYLEKLANRLNQMGVEPLHLTLVGLFFNAIGCVFYADGLFVIGSLVIIFASIFDMLDGVLARNSQKASKFGAFIDSVIDRYSDFLIFGGIGIYFARMGNISHVVLILVVIAGSMMTSYTKARAESLIKNCSVGWFGRPERIFIVCFGGLFGLMIPALWVLAIMTNITAIQRINFVWKKTESKGAKDFSSKHLEETKRI